MKIINTLFLLIHFSVFASSQSPGTIDSLWSIYEEDKEVTNAVQDSKAKYEIEKKEETIALLEKENQLNEFRLRNNRYFIIFSVSLLLIFLVLLAFLYNLYKSSKKLATLEKQQAQKLAEINDFRSNLFANISHEFRTPLSIIYTPLKQMKAGNFKGDRQKYFDIMLKNTTYLLNLVEEMIDLSKLKEGIIVLNQEDVEIASFTKYIIERLEPAILSKNLSLQLTTPKKKVLGSFDKKMMTKVITNLLSNAIKFTDAKGHILVNLHFWKHNWELTIQDNGIGIPQEELSLIFDRYYRGYVGQNADTTGGLGLALVKEVVELHKGTIAVNSKEGEETTFKITIPCLKESIPAMANNEVETIHYNQEKLRLTAPPIYQEYPTLFTVDKEDRLPLILIIEDNIDLNNMIADQLKKDYRVIQTYNGKEGLAQAEQQMPDFILSDLIMPIMDGVQFLEVAQQSALIRHIPIIILSALEQNIKDNQVWKLGILDFITKPIDFDILKFKLNNILENKKRFQQRYFAAIGPNKFPATIPKEATLPHILDNSFAHLKK